MSGSLLGSQSHPEPNDEYGHRISITKNIVHRLAEHVESSPLVHRVSVIEFGTKVKKPLTISNLELAYDPNSPGDASRLVRRHLSLLEVAKLDYTNTAEAIKKAGAEFNKMEAASGYDPTREKFLLLFTDGRPSLPSVSTKKLRKRTKIHAAILTQKGTDIWVVGLNDADNYWNEYDGPKFWEPIAGRDRHGVHRARLAYQAYPLLASVARYMADEWLQVTGEKVFGDKTICPPYLRRIVFDAHFNKPGARLRITTPKGHTVDPTFETKLSARYVFDDPSDGTYQLVKTPGFGYKIYVEKFSAIPVFLAPKPTANQNVETRVVFQLMKTHTALNSVQGLPQAKISIVPPSGKAQMLDAKFEGNGKFVATWTPIEEGEHKVIFVEGMDGSKNKFFDNKLNPIIEETVKVMPDSQPKPPLWLRLETPKHSYTLRWFFPWHKAANIKVALQEGKQAEHRINDLENYITDPDGWLSVRKMDKSGVPTSDPMALKRDSENYFVGDMPVKVNWIKGEGWWYPGQLNLKFIAPSNSVRDARLFNGVWLPAGLEEKRVNGEPMTIVIDVRLSKWIRYPIYGLFLLVLIVACFIFLKLFWIYFRDKQREINLLIYDCMEGSDGINTHKYSIAGKRKINLDNKIKMVKDDKTLVAQQFRVTRASREPPLVEINYRWNSDLRHLKVRCGDTKLLEGTAVGSYVVRLDCKEDKVAKREKTNRVKMLEGLVLLILLAILEELVIRLLLGND
jgi:hypothetical protein